MLTCLTSVASVTSTAESIHQINTLSSVLAGLCDAVIDILVTVLSRPSWLTHTLVFEEPINTETICTGRVSAQIYLYVAPLACESIGAAAVEVMHEVSTVGTQKAGIISTVINVLITQATFPAWQTLAAEAALL